MARVLVGQPSALLCGALAAVLSGEPDLRVIAELSGADGVLATAARERPDVAVLDDRLPGAVSVGELCRVLHRTVPGCHPLVLLSPQGVDLGRSLATFVPWLGMLTTDTAPAALADGIRRLARGEPVLDRELATRVGAARPNPLTTREAEVLRRARYGAPSKEIARQLGLQVGTVRNYLHRGVAKTGARTRLEATGIAQDAGWI